MGVEERHKAIHRLGELGISPHDIRETAYNWHHGQWSDLYSFASTDLTIHSEEHRQGLLCEVETCIDRFDRGQHDDPDAEFLKLTQLKQAIELIPVR